MEITESALEPLKALITNRFPELSNGEFSLLTAGWDSLAVDVDDELIFKFPRDQAAENSLRKEASLLRIIRPAVTIPVPALTLIPGPPLFSRHAKLRGEHLVTAEYERLPEAARQELAFEMARFYAELHALDNRVMEAAGAGPLDPWPPAEEMLRACWPVLPPELRPLVQRTLTLWEQLPPDPYGSTYGFFDGHGWNMAFDHPRQKLNGIYDFGDSGIGMLHQEFLYSSFVSPDLTARIVAAYQNLTGRALDSERIHLLTGAYRLSELAELVGDPEHLPTMLQSVVQWASGNR